MERIFHANGKGKKAQIAVLINEKINFKTKAIPRDKEGHYIMVKETICPGWCGSVDCMLDCKPKGHWFDSQSGLMPGWWARSPVDGT